MDKRPEAVEEAFVTARPDVRCGEGGRGCERWDDVDDEAGFLVWLKTVNGDE